MIGDPGRGMPWPSRSMRGPSRGMRSGVQFFAAGAATVALSVIVLHVLAAVAFGAVPGVLLPAFVGIFLGTVSLLLFVGLGRLAARFAGWLSTDVTVVILAAAASLMLLRATLFRWPDALFPGLLAVVFFGLFAVGSGLALAARPLGSTSRYAGLALGGIGLFIVGFGVSWFLSAGSDPYPRGAIPQPEPPAALLAEDPAAPGPYAVRSLTYGSGSDRRRPEFGEGVHLESPPTDLRLALPEWAGFRASHREWWWGFGLDEAPRNGRLALPEVAAGDRRPVALIVHGNHRMDDFSDAGYEYLTGLLASHGIVAVSVDANFLNGAWSGDFGGREMPARAILLLEHLRLLRTWSRNPRTPLYNRLDFDRVALLGHSRGGEAAAIAAAFNDLDHFPDNAEFDFEYGFGIESVVAIAQIDRRYSRRIELEDVNFLAIHGSYDTDEPSFHGLRQFHRVRLDGTSGRPEGPLGFRLKAGVLLHRGNHGQFNSTWGMDSGLFGVFFLNRAPLLPEEDQRRAAAAYIAAFLRATLLGQERFLPLLRDYRAGSEFLPDTLYQNQYQDSRTEILVGFEEDLDLGTGTVRGSAISAHGFAGWSEEEVLFRDGSKQATSAVRLEVSGEGAAIPSWEVRFEEPIQVGEGDRFAFSMVWDPDLPEPFGGGARERPAVAASVEFLFEEGVWGPAVPVADILSPEPPFEVRFLKSARMNRERYRRTTEEIPQAISIPAERLLLPAPPAEEAPADEAPAGSEGLSLVRGVRFRFDPAVGGEVLLDDIGFRRALPAPDPEAEGETANGAPG